MHADSRPRGEPVEILPAAVSPVSLPHRGRSWPAWCACREHRPGCTPATARAVSLPGSCPRPIVARARVSPLSQFRAEKKIRGLRLPRRAENLSTRPSLSTR